MRLGHDDPATATVRTVFEATPTVRSWMTTAISVFQSLNCWDPWCSSAPGQLLRLRTVRLCGSSD